MRTVLSVGLILAMLFLVYDAASDRYYIRDRSNKRFGFGISRISYPEKAIDFIQGNNIQGNMFNNPATGHYFTWRCFPERMVFLDGRFDFPDRFLSHYYVPELWPKISEKYKIDYVLLGHGRSPNIAGLTRMLYFNKDWALVYYDEMAVVFVRDIPKNRMIIERFQVGFGTAEAEKTLPAAPRKNLFGQLDLPMAQFQLGNLYATFDLNRRAINKYKECIEIYPDFWETRNNLGDMFRRLGRLKEALEEYGRVVAIEPDFVAGYVRLGDVYAALRMLPQAIEAYRKAINRGVKQAAVHRGLGLAYMQTKNYKEAVLQFDASLRLNPGDRMARQMLAYCRRMGSEDNRDQ